MIKKFILISVICILYIGSFSQSVLPNESTEFCPLEDITFTVTIPKVEDNSTPTVISWTNGPIIISGASNITNTQFHTTFSFIGRFKDVNIKQAFRVKYKTDSNPDGNYDIEFKKIKSLYYTNSLSTSCPNIQPNQTIITADLCKIVNTTISFNNVKWSTYGENPAYCFGAITEYEYQLPAGWSIGMNTSTGSNWIAGSNSVTVTSDETSGNGEYIKIRPANNCVSGLTNGYTPAQIYITRPSPPLNISGPSQLCFPDSYPFLLTGAPIGSSVTWNTSSYYTITGVNNTATVSPTSTANGGSSVSASVEIPGCGISFPVSVPISIGVPYVAFNIVSYPYSEPVCYEIWGIYTFKAQQISGYPNTFTGYEWGWRNLTNSTVSNDPTIYGSGYTFIPEEAGDYEIWVRATNECGSAILESVKNVKVYNFCTGMIASQSTLNVYPNPATSQITIKVPKEVNSKNKVVQLINSAGTVVLTEKIYTYTNTLDIDLSNLKKGIYQIILRAGTETRQTKIIKQ